jgi:ribonuclease R
MFMVEANEAVASFLDRQNACFMRRIHPEPDAIAMQNLVKLVRAFGYNLRRPVDRRGIQVLLAAVKDTECAAAINMAVLRSFEKAEYSPSNVGHWALASRHYCHFTSPIRRYADLMVHRVLEDRMTSEKTSAAGGAEGPDLVETGRHITFTEQRAEDAERELKTVLILQMLSGRVGDELDCVVTGLASFGVFAQCRKFGIEGLISLEDLGPDRWRLKQESQCIYGLRTGCTVRLGQAIKVRIASVNLPARHLNLVPAEPLTGKPRRGKSRRR